MTTWHWHRFGGVNEMIQNTPDKCRGLVVRTGLEPVWDSEPLLPLGVPPSLFQLTSTIPPPDYVNLLF